MKTKAAILNRINQPLSVEELIIPELKTGQVLVKVAYSGVCRSQLNEIRGLKGPDKYLPHTLGHEGAGVVEAVGPGVKKVKAGDHAILTWLKGQGIDMPASAYKRNNHSRVNSGAISTFLTKAVISENRLVKIPRKIPLKVAALFGCALPTGAGIIINTAKVSRKDSVAVFGLGGIGLSALLAAKIKKAALIIAVDVQQHKIEQALELGATQVINARSEDVLARIKEITKGRGVDFAIEASGKRSPMEIAFSAVRDNGGLCIIAGNLPYGERISINPFDLIRGKRIVGSWGGQMNPDTDIPMLMKLFLCHNSNLPKLIAKIYNLEDINEAIIDLEQGRSSGRILLDMS